MGSIRAPHEDIEDDRSSTYKSRAMSEVSKIDDEPTERSPLLSPNSERGDVHELSARRHDFLQSSQSIIWALIVVVVLIESGDQLMDSPQTRIIESVICYRYYERTDPSKIRIGREGVGPGAIGGVDELWCKADAVQSELAMLRGYQQLLNGIPALLMAIPIGWAADRYGRKPFLLLGIASLIFQAAWIQFITFFWQAFDIRMTWLSTLHGFMAGTSPVIGGLFFVTLSDIAPEATRAAVFLRVSAFDLLANLCMPPLGAWLMTYNPWIPSFIGTFLGVLSFFVYMAVPETLGFRHTSLSPSTTPPSTPRPETISTSAPASSTEGSIREPLTKRMLKKFRASIAFLTDDWRVPALIVPFFAHTIVGSVSMLLLQYISKRYKITLARSTLVLTIMYAFRVLLLMAILPWISNMVMRVFHLSDQRKDLYLARASQILIVVGWALIGFSPNIPAVVISMIIASLGQGALVLARSFITSLVPAHHIARVYSIISIVDTLGGMFGGAMLAGLFKRGVELGGGWIGLPFWFIAMVAAVCTILMFVVRLRKGEDEESSDATASDC